MAITKGLSVLFSRDIKKVADEIQAYHDEANIWRTDEQISNSAGNLALHICGNLQHFIGAILGNTGYVRERDKEFNLKDVPASKIVKELQQAEEVVINVLGKVSAEDLEKEYPAKISGRKYTAETETTETFLLHLLAHLNYHLGQINYHRRLLEKQV